ncbi:MAG: cysteine peptidase family C39 domain-containing protein [Acidobacteriota bacterium]
MFLNPNMFIAFLLGVVLFYMGYWVAGRVQGVWLRKPLLRFFFILCLPALSFIGYYLHLINDPLWYIEFRSIDHIELTTALWGLLFGFVAGTRFALNGVKEYILNRYFMAMLLLIFIPFMKPMIMPVGFSHFDNHWQDGVCLQSTRSTCGPSSLAAIFRHYGINRTEREIARGSYSSMSGTENWYLIRYARKNGLQCRCENVKQMIDVPVPAIIGVRLGGFGHFITVLGHENGKVIIGDPLQGRLKMTEAEFNHNYEFTGFVMYYARVTKDRSN